MTRRVDVATAMKFVKFICLPVCSWPLPLNSSSSVIFRRNLLRWGAIFHLVVAEVGLFYSILKHTDDMERMILIVTEFCAFLLIHGKIIICSRMSHDLQLLFHGMDEFVKNANAEEMEVVQQIVERCSLAYSIPPLFALVGGLSYLIAPAFNSQIFPLATQYPFSISSIWVRSALYVSQIVSVGAVSSTGNMDTMCATLLWYVIARFKILSTKIRKATEVEEIKDSIATHIELFEYVDLLVPVVRALTAWTAFLTTFGLIGAGYMLLRGPSPYEMVKFTCFELVALLELFIYCWPADNLIEASEDIGEAAATCEWIGKSREMRKNIIIMIQRSLIPAIIHAAGILPPLSLQFCASTLSSNFGYLTALRSLMESTDGE